MTVFSRCLGAVLVAVVLATGYTPKNVPPVSADATPTTLLVKYRPGVSDSKVAAFNASNGASDRGFIEGAAVTKLALPRGADARAMATRYVRSGLVEFAEADALVAHQMVVDDPLFLSAWHLAKIEAPAAWDLSRASGILIGVCDSGFADHPDLSTSMRMDLAYNAVDGSNNVTPVSNHGTLVAGAVAAATNNGLGVAGVAYGAQVIPVRISNRADGSAYVSDAANCVTYAADHGARVVNISYRMADSPTMDSAAKYAERKGAVVVIAAGNDGLSQSWPNYQSILAVGATESADNVAWYSNRGSFVDVLAPGTGIYTTWPDGTYNMASGTSFAAPLATGVLSLIFAKKPVLSPAQARDILASTTDNVGAASGNGSGRINARRALEAANGGAVAAPPPSPGTVDETFSGTLGGRKGAVKASHEVTLGTGGLVDTTLEVGGRANFDLAVYDEAGALLATSSNGSGTERISLEAAGGARLRFEVTAVSGRGSYVLRVVDP